MEIGVAAQLGALQCVRVVLNLSCSSIGYIEIGEDCVVLS